MLACMKCGKTFENVESVAKFCPYCGSILQERESEIQVVAVAQSDTHESKAILNLGKSGLIIGGIAEIISIVAMTVLTEISKDFSLFHNADDFFNVSIIMMIITIFVFIISVVISLRALVKASNKIKSVGFLERSEKTGKILGLIGAINSGLWIINTTPAIIFFIVAA